jgi:sulfite reductase beta subunit-like hemoprotein
MWTEVHELAALLREGETKWEDLNLDDVDIRMKFAGLFHRGKRTPKRFMMRLKVRMVRLKFITVAATRQAHSTVLRVLGHKPCRSSQHCH